MGRQYSSDWEAVVLHLKGFNEQSSKQFKTKDQISYVILGRTIVLLIIADKHSLAGELLVSPSQRHDNYAS